MQLIQIYQCLCEPIRLRIVNLLVQGPLCVCHIQNILAIPQAKVSQHLAYLRKRKMVETTRKGIWVIYSLPAKPSPELEMNLECLQDCTVSDKLFRNDLARLAKLKEHPDWNESPLKESTCC